jgi:hypothetical protein
MKFQELRLGDPVYRVVEHSVYENNVKQLTQTGPSTLDIKLENLYSTVENVVMDSSFHLLRGRGEILFTLRDAADHQKMKNIVDAANKFITEALSNLDQLLDYMKVQGKFYSNSSYKPDQIREIIKQLKKLHLKF